MRSIRRLAFLSLVVLLLMPAAASAGERSRREILPQVDIARILEILAQPWRLLWQNPETALNKGGGTMDPNGNPSLDGDDCTSWPGDGGGTMDPNG